MKKRSRRKFTSEYKAEVVRLVRDGGKTIGEAVSKTGFEASVKEPTDSKKGR